MSKKVISEILVNEWKLANGWSPARILQEHFAAEQRFAKTASEGMEAAEARVMVAGITLDFVKDVAKSLKTSIGSVVEIFKNAKIVRFFTKIDWSFDKLYSLLRRGYTAYKEIREEVREFAMDLGIRGDRWSREQLQKLDNFVSKNSKLMRISGIALGGLLAFLWLNQAFIGDPNYDFDTSEILDALTGNVSFSDIFGGQEGLMLLAVLAMGAGEVSFPWPGSGTAQFVSSIVISIISRMSLHFRKERPEKNEIIPALTV